MIGLEIRDVMMSLTELGTLRTLSEGEVVTLFEVPCLRGQRGIQVQRLSRQLGIQECVSG